MPLLQKLPVKLHNKFFIRNMARLMTKVHSKNMVVTESSSRKLAHAPPTLQSRHSPTQPLREGSASKTKAIDKSNISPPQVQLGIKEIVP